MDDWEKLWTLYSKQTPIIHPLQLINSPNPPWFVPNYLIISDLKERRSKKFKYATDKYAIRLLVHSKEGWKEAIVPNSMKSGVYLVPVMWMWARAKNDEQYNQQ